MFIPFFGILDNLQINFKERLLLTSNISFVDGKIRNSSRFAGFMELVYNELNIPSIEHYRYIARNWVIIGEIYIE